MPGALPGPLAARSRPTTCDQDILLTAFAARQPSACARPPASWRSAFWPPGFPAGPESRFRLQNRSLAAGLILLPLLVGLAGALLAASSAQRASRLPAAICLQDLHHSLENRLPVFNDQAGLAMLIDNFLVYDRQMKDSLQDFTATASRLAESDMADGIRRSVEQVLQESVAPSIQQAAATLGSLAGELTNRQERGMQDLAVRFADRALGGAGRPSPAGQPGNRPDGHSDGRCQKLYRVCHARARNGPAAV